VPGQDGLRKGGGIDPVVPGEVLGEHDHHLGVSGEGPEERSAGSLDHAGNSH